MALRQQLARTQQIADIAQKEVVSIRNRAQSAEQGYARVVKDNELLKQEILLLNKKLTDMMNPGLLAEENDGDESF